MKKLGLAVLALTIALPLLASARHADLQDRDDARGPLDIRRVEVAGTAATPRWMVTTYGAWSAKRIWDRGFVLVELDTFGSKRVDYYVLVRSTGSRLSGALFRDRASKPDRKITAVRVTRRNRRTVAASAPLRRMRRRSGGVYSWFVLSLFNSRDCSQVCFDRAPERGAVTEPGATATPTPSLPTTLPTPTLTPTPTP